MNKEGIKVTPEELVKLVDILLSLKKLIEECDKRFDIIEDRLKTLDSCVGKIIEVGKQESELDEIIANKIHEMEAIIKQLFDFHIKECRLCKK
jgi:AICAR transformylase/IMP cyclohydrolase PurH